MDPVSEPHVQGEGAKVVWDDLYPLFYAHPVLTEAYERQSRLLAGIAYALLAHKGNMLRGLDIGCGHGTTTLALAEAGIKTLTAIDIAPGLLGLLQSQAGPSGVSNFERDLLPLHEYGASSGFEPTLAVLKDRQRRFMAARPILDVMQLSAWQMSEIPRIFDVVAANGSFHWPVAEGVAKLLAPGRSVTHEFATAQALSDLLEEARNKLSPGGVLALGQSSDYIVLDNETADKALLASGLTSHPVYWLMNEELNRGLAEINIERSMPPSGDTRNKVFFEKTFRSVAEERGFGLETFAQFELGYDHDPVQAFALRAPLWLGKFDPREEKCRELTFRRRMEIISSATDRVRARSGEWDPRTPLREQFFVIALRRVG